MRDVIGALLLALLGAAALRFGADLGMGQLRAPGSGALPRASAGIVLLLSLLLLLRGLKSLRRGAGALAPPGAAASVQVNSGADGRAAFGAGRVRIAVVVALIAAFAWALPRAGFLLTTSFLMTALFSFARPRRRWTAPLLGLAAAALAYLLFHQLLGVPLPRGSWWDS